MRITDEQKERANLVNLPQFLMSHGFDLKKFGKEYVWKEHDSLHIKDNGPGERGQWFRFSENKGGDNIGLLREYMDMSFIDAVEALTGEHIDRTYTPSNTYESKPVQQTARELSLAEADNCRRVFAYLCKTRGLDYDMLSALIKKGVISQEEKTGNVLFKYFDTDGKVIGAEKVGTSTEHKFKGIATGSAGGHGFEVVRGTGEKAFFFESAIDMLSYLQMHSNELDNCRLVSMMGVKPSIVLDTMLRHNIAPENVYLCSDNDTAGNEFAQRLQEQYPDMKRIITPDTYKDWNDMLRGIPKVVEQETEKKEVDSVADLITYGNQMWHKATDNRDKSLVTIQAADFARLQEQLDNSGINYYAYARDNSVIMAINDKDMEWFRQIAGTPDLVPNKSNRPYSPSEKNIFGSAEYRYIPQKEYLSDDRDLVLKMAEIMSKRGMQFSGRVYPSGKGTLTVSHADLFAVRNIRDEVINMRKQFASSDKAQEVGNRDYRANSDTHYYMSRLTPEQFKEVKPFLETSVSYHAVSRDGKVAFAVDKENALAFHRALENAVREVGMLRNMADLDLTKDEQTVDLMSDAADISDTSSPADDVPVVTLKYKGDAESLDEIKDKALSLGATVIIDNAEGVISIDTYENHRAEIDGAVYELGLMAVDDNPAVSEDIDKPLFTDASVIEEIQRSEDDDVPFWEKPDIEGEQLSLFGDPEPLTASKPAPEKPKSEFAKGPVVDGVQVYEALAAEIDRGTGFVHGKLRVQDFYEEKHPTIQELADFLKKEYGIGGHSGDGNISLVDYDSKGLTFSFENGEKFRHSWYNVATMTESRLRDDTYLSAEQKAERAALKAEQTTEVQPPIPSRSVTDFVTRLLERFLRLFR